MRTGAIFEHNPVAKREFERCEFYQDFHRRFARGLDATGACILFEEPVSAAISLTRRANKSDYGRADHSLIRMLLPHTQRAMSILRRASMVELERAALGDVFDHLGAAIFVLDERGRFIVYNRTAAGML